MIRLRNGGAHYTTGSIHWHQQVTDSIRDLPDGTHQNQRDIKPIRVAGALPYMAVNAPVSTISIKSASPRGHVIEVLYPEILKLDPEMPGIKTTPQHFHLSDYMRKSSESFNAMGNILNQERHLLFFGVGHRINPRLESRISWASSLGISSPRQIPKKQDESEEAYTYRRDLVLLSRLMSPSLQTARKTIELYVDMNSLFNELPWLKEEWAYYFVCTPDQTYLPKQNIVYMILKTGDSRARALVEGLKKHMKSRKAFRSGELPEYYFQRVSNFMETSIVYINMCYSDTEYKSFESLRSYISGIVYDLACSVFKGPGDKMLSDEELDQRLQPVQEKGKRRYNRLKMDLNRYYGILSKTNECISNKQECLKNVYEELREYLFKISGEFLPQGIPVSPGYYQIQLEQIEKCFQGSRIQISE